jgi:hypothetical protein
MPTVLFDDSLRDRQAESAEVALKERPGIGPRALADLHHA